MSGKPTAQRYGHGTESKTLFSTNHRVQNHHSTNQNAWIQHDDGAIRSWYSTNHTVTTSHSYENDSNLLFVFTDVFKYVVQTMRETMRHIDKIIIKQASGSRAASSCSSDVDRRELIHNYGSEKYLSKWSLEGQDSGATPDSNIKTTDEQTPE